MQGHVSMVGRGGVMDQVWEPCLWFGATKQIHMLCVCVGCGIPAATSRVEFQLNEFICLANLTKAWIFSPCWLVLVRVRHWQQSNAGKIKPTPAPELE